MELADFLKDSRLEKGYSQEELSARSSISTRTIQRIEKGHTKPREDTLHLLLEALDIPKSSLESIHNYRKKPPRNGFPFILAGTTISGSSIGSVLGIPMILSQSNNMNDNMATILFITCITFFTGLGLIIGYYIQSKHDQKK